MNENELKYQRARKRVETLRSFYIHLIVYVVVNLLLFFINMYVSPDNLWFFWPLLGWGIAIVLHALNVFSSGRYLGSEWEEKKIKEFMDKE